MADNATAVRERPELPSRDVWHRMDRCERMEVALALLVDAVTHEARDNPYSYRVRMALSIAAEIESPDG